jgi:hypothetical protein
MAKVPTRSVFNLKRAYHLLSFESARLNDLVHGEGQDDLAWVTSNLDGALTSLELALPRVPCANPECSEMLVPVNGRIYHSPACQKRAAGARHRARRAQEQAEMEAHERAKVLKPWGGDNG